MIFIDANVFLAYSNLRDVHHIRAVELFQRMDPEEQYFTTDYVLNEVVGVTFRKLGKDQAIEIGEHLFNTILIVSVDEHMLREAWRFFRAHDSQLNLVDCTNLVIMKLAHTQRIATFDNEFKKTKGIIVIQ